MNSNTINAQKMLSFLSKPEPVVKAKKAPAKKAPVVEDYPYETESSDSEVEVIEKPKKKKEAKKEAKKEVKTQAALPQPAPPAAMTSIVPVVEIKEKKVRAKKEKVAVDPFASAAVVAQGGSTGDSNLSAKKQKRAPSLYNKFASEKMKAGMSMKDVAAAWKAEKEKQK